MAVLPSFFNCQDAAKTFENIALGAICGNWTQDRPKIAGLALLHCMAAFGIGLPGGALAPRQFSVMRV